MRRWRLPDGRTLVEAPAADEVSYYMLHREGEVDRAYGKTVTSIDNEVHRVSFYVLGRQLMCRHLIERPGRSKDASRLEADGLELLSPNEKPTVREAQDAISTYKHGADKLEKARRQRIDGIVESAPASVRPLVKRLAEKVVYDDDDLSREMMQAMAALAKLRRQSETPSVHQREATEAIQLAARFLTFDPGVREVELPAPKESESLALIRRLEQLRREVLDRAITHQRAAGLSSESEAARAYQRSADMLELALRHLGRELPL